MRTVLPLLAVVVCALTPGIITERAAPSALRFEPNQGQYHSDFDFVMRGGDYTAFFFEDRVSFVGTDARDHMRFTGSTTSKIRPSNRTRGHSNYYLGNDASKWRERVPHFQRLRYQDVWPGVDIEFYFRDEKLEYDIVVGRDGDLDDVAIEMAGPLVASSNSLTTTRFKHTIVSAFDLQEHRPVASAFQLEDGVVSFRADQSSNVVIDPIIEFATYLGGSSTDYGWSVAASNTDVWAVGQTSATDFPLANEYQATLQGTADVFITRMNENGILFSTYFGGTGVEDCFSRVAVDDAGNIAISGFTNSSDMPVLGTPVPFENTYQGNNDGFVAKFSPAGALVLSTYLGGTENDYASAVDHAADGDLVITGYTASPDFPVSNNAYQDTLAGGNDAFVFRLAAGGNSQVWSTLLGGALFDNARDIELDANEAALIGGTTNSTDFPETTNGAQPSLGGNTDSFVALVRSDGASVAYASYLGGSNNENFGGVTILPDGRHCVGSSTGSADYPTTTGAYQEVLRGQGDFAVTCLLADGSDFSFSTYFGGSDGESFGDIDGLPDNAIAIGVQSSSDDIPVSLPGPKIGGTDAVGAVLGADGSYIRYAVYFGGTGSDEVYATAATSNAELVIAGFTRSDDLILVNEVQSTYLPVGDTYVARFSDLPEHLTLNINGPGQLGLGQSATMTVELSSAHFSDLPIALSADGSNVALPPGTTIQSGDTSVELEIVGNQPGSTTITATLPDRVGAEFATSEMTVVDNAASDDPGCQCAVAPKETESRFVLLLLGMAFLAVFRGRRS